MSNPVSSDLRDELKAFAHSVLQIVKAGVENADLKPNDEAVNYWKVDHFEYGDEGVVGFGAHSDEKVRKSWGVARVKAELQLQKSGLYSTTTEKLKQQLGENPRIEGLLNGFAGVIIQDSLESTSFADDVVNPRMESFLSDLLGHPVKCKATVELQGVILRPAHFEIEHGVSLRKPRIEDLEEEIDPFSLSRRRLGPHPTAILEVETTAASWQELQPIVFPSVAALRLFRVGTVAWSALRASSESVASPIGGTLSASGPVVPLEKYVITEEDVPKLRAFWGTVVKKIPPGF